MLDPGHRRAIEEWIVEEYQLSPPLLLRGLFLLRFRLNNKSFMQSPQDKNKNTTVIKILFAFSSKKNKKKKTFCFLFLFLLFHVLFVVQRSN